MMHYAHYGFKDFVIALGYKGEVLKKYLCDFASMNGNLTVDLKSGVIIPHGGYRPDWIVELIETSMER